MEEWEFSSFKDYLGLRNGTLCDKDLAIDLLGINIGNFYQESYDVIPSEQIKRIF